MTDAAADTQRTEDRPTRALHHAFSDLREILEPRVKRRVAVGAAAAVGLAVVEAGALALMFPLMLTISTIEDNTIPGSVRWLADLMSIDDANQFAVVVGVIAVSFFVIKSALVLAYTRWSLRFVTEAEAEARIELFRTYLYAPFEFHLDHNTAELHRTLSNSLQRIFREVVTYFMTAIADAFVLVAAGLVLVLLEPVAALAAVGYFALVSFGYQKTLHGRTQHASERLHEGLVDSHRFIHQGLHSAKDIHVLGRQEHFVERLAVVERDLAPKNATVTLLTHLPRYYLELSLIIGVAVMGALSFSLYEADRAVAIMGLFVAAGFRSLPSLNRLLVAIATIRVGLPSIAQVRADLIELRSTAAITTSAQPGLRPDGPPGVRLEHISYTYPTRIDPALYDIDLRIEPGEMIGVVGPSGAGKTTLVDVILGLLEPTTGAVTVNGAPLSSLPRETIGYVPQNVSMLDETLAANIAFGAKIEEDRLASAIQRAQLQDVVSALPCGLNTLIGELGSRVSGGQRQRIGIARALYHEPSLLVLDEATSALDSETEANIATTIETMRATMTMLIIAHRLSTVRSCSRLVFMANGRIEGIGTFDDLLATNASFARLVRLGDSGIPRPATPSSRSSTKSNDE